MNNVAGIQRVKSLHIRDVVTAWQGNNTCCHRNHSETKPIWYADTTEATPFSPATHGSTVEEFSFN